MQWSTRRRAIHSVLALSMLFGVGGGCVAIYSFDDFEKQTPRPCKTTADCPQSNECGQHVCEGQICKVVNPVQLGKLTVNNVLGDCLRFTCDGRGNEVVEFDLLDVRNDGDDCTIDACATGTPTNEQAPVNTPCGKVPNVRCNAAGACAGCVVPTDCGEDNACTTWGCTDGICTKNIKVVGTILDALNPGDCRAVICNALGEPEEAIVPDDAPSDGNECTTDACTIDGTVEHLPANIDTPCGTCGVCTPDGTCVACDPTTFDCYEGTCIPKPKPCKSGSECPSTYCVDDFCCDQECTSTCMACSNDLTGVPSGLCAPVTDGTDPDGDCELPADKCWEGQCRCENGKPDGDETGVDCGGGICNACTGRWTCGGAAACSGVGAATSCCNYPACFNCIDQSGECNSLEGQTCALGAAPKKLSLELVFQGGCISLTGCRSVTCNCIP